MKRRTFLKTSSIAIGLAVAGCASDSSGTDSGGVKEPQKAAQIVSQESGVTEYGSPAVRGTIENTSDSELSYVQVEARFYDSDDTRVGTGMDNVTNLEAGGRWKFEALCMDCPDPESLDSYELEVTAEF